MYALIAAGLFFIALTVGVCGFALLRGGALERAAAAAFLLAVLGTMIAEQLSGAGWHGPEYGVALVDVLHFTALLVIVHRSNRFWPLWAAASQMVATLTHVIVALRPQIPMEAYLAIQPFWAFPVLIAIAIGTWGHRRTTA